MVQGQGSIKEIKSSFLEIFGMSSEIVKGIWRDFFFVFKRTYSIVGICLNLACYFGLFFWPWT